MATFLMFGKYTPEAMKEISADRTKAAQKLVKQMGGKIQAMYATLGENDLVAVVNLPSTDDALKASIALNRMTGIVFSTIPAVAVEDFDKMVGEIGT